MSVYLVQLMLLCIIVQNVLLGKETTDGKLKYTKRDEEKFCTAKDNKHCTTPKCWGYEKNCVEGEDFYLPSCTDKGYSRNLDDQRRLFWQQTGFGYVKKFIESLHTVCASETNSGTSLKCTKGWEYCRAKNLYIDLRNQKFDDTSNKYAKGFLKHSEIGGKCIIDNDFMLKEVRFDGELNAWKADFLNFGEMTASMNCDVTITQPTIFMKLDSGFNLYHHFCDFVNLYASQHINGSFNEDINIVHWDPTNSNYFDLFEDVWPAFSKHPLSYLSKYKGKRVCFQDAIFSLPPRMPYGLFYNMPVALHCHGSTFFEAFNEHLMDRLGISQDQFDKDIVRVTLLTRSTQYRRILNRDELVGAMKRVKILNVTVVDYKYREMPFLEQMKRSHNSDILIGMHGAGLTHSLFQPHWGALFELYNTEDPDCYRDLANIRGVEYFTWENKELLFQQDKGHHPTLGEHPKFTNYAFNVDEFMRILGKAVKGVLKRRQERTEIY
ncbi:EGF domain-specific O-linked N-acetylglucosamine transferase-like [Clytia hemisphaerica]|uniref:EGF domain-specific O-linked N-acetylglucosamine transferase-like n=1 Tax=Clytia hemisphaerica TaxID=252671 RepID=UPI0034D79BC8